MNKPARPIFSKIITAMTTYNDTVSAICEKYRKDLAAAAKYAAKYKDEKQILADKRAELSAEARKAIKYQGREMGVAVAECLDKLKDLVETDLCHAVPRGTLDLLNLYNTYGINPTKTEIEALVTINAGHPTGLRCIQAMLKKNGSAYTVKFADTNQLEDDIISLAQFAVMAEYTPAVPQEYLHEAVQIFAGKKETEVVPAPANAYGTSVGDTLKTNELAKAAHIYRFKDGEAVDTMRDHDIISLQVACTDFTNMFTAAQNMSKYWSADVGELELSEADYENLPAEESATSIEESEEPAIELAREMGKETARSNAPISKEILEANGMK